MSIRKKLRRNTLFMVAISIFFMLFLVGCTPKPSNSQIEEAVKITLKNSIPVSWVGNLLGGRNASLKVIEVVEFGKFNKKEEYWPVRIRVVGSANLKDPFNQGKVEHFDRIAEFKFSQDDYGNWKASLSGGRFQ